jgi:gamma-glutamyl:cysteine ligase YbdK (ATP-grasp superfamily)
MNRREQAQRVGFHEELQRIQQQARDERGRQRWCREHPKDKNCRQ